MVSPMKLTLLSAAPKQLFRYANPNHLKTERSGSNFRLCGECWPDSSKFSSLMEMTKVHLLSQRSMLAHKFSASRVVENLCSKLAPFGSGQLFTLVAPDLCVFLVFLVKSCNGSSLKPARPMCDDRRPFCLTAFSPPGGSRHPFPRFPVSMGPTLGALSDSQHNRA